METAVAEKKETPAGEQGNVSAENKAQAEAGAESQGQASPAEKSSVEAKPKASGNKSEPTFAHVTLMEANGIKPESLPKELKMKINAWSMGVRKYSKNPTPKLLEMVKKGSVEIADLIQDWKEKDLPEKTEEQILAENKAKEEKIKKENEAKELERQNNEKAQRIKSQREEAERKQRDEIARKERELQTKKDAQEKVAQAQKSKEQKVASILSEKGKIRYNELVEILGQDVGESVQVGSIKLLNVFLTNNYKQVE
jgi:hypothetical protein